MQKVKLNGTEIYRFEILSGYKGIKHFVSTRNAEHTINFNISLWAVEEIMPVIGNRKILASALEIPLSSFVFQQQMHTNKVIHVGRSDSGRGVNEYKSAFEDNDAMISNEKGICLAVTLGDCVPILFYDPVKEVIGAAHSGWRGTANRIAEETVFKMKELYHSNPSDIIVGIGPSISQENYEVDEIVLNAFSKTYIKTKDFFKPAIQKGKYLLDLWKANQLQLIDAGILVQNIEISKLCTYKNNQDFFSARRGDSGRFGCGIMMI